MCAVEMFFLILRRIGGGADDNGAAGGDLRNHAALRAGKFDAIEGAERKGVPEEARFLGNEFEEINADVYVGTLPGEENVASVGADHELFDVYIDARALGGGLRTAFGFDAGKEFSFGR